MTSAIDPSKPTEGNAFTADVRTNFATAQAEITDLQAAVADLQLESDWESAVANLQSQIDAINAQITTIKARYMAASNLVSDNPPNTNSNTYVTAGLNISFSSTSSTRGLFTAEGSLGNTANNATSQFQMIYGAGNPPAPLTPIENTNGTLVGAPVAITTTKAGETRPFSVTAIIEGLVPGKSTYWIGGAFCSPSAGGTATLSEVTVTAFELLDPLP